VAAALRADGRLLGGQALLDVVTAVQSDLTGAGPLEPLLQDPEVTDVLVNAPDEVWVERDGVLERADVRFASEEAVRRLAQRLAASAGRRLDGAAPTVDARVGGGVRLHAVLPPISPTGTLVSLRILRQRAFSIDELVARGTLSPECATFLIEIVRNKLSFLVTGGTGSGKTTLLATLLGLVPPSERLVLVEDSGELRPVHPHVVRLEARLPNVEGAGAVDLRDLVRQALRMRPDRLVVGEVRGAEVVDLLAALNTGHEGGCGTVHANSAESLPFRLEGLALAAGLGRDALHSQLATGVQVAVHLGRRGGGVRQVTSISVLERGAGGLVGVEPALSLGGDGKCRVGPGAHQLAQLLGTTVPT
jgi:pilus assembly protein CpaF